MHELCAANKHTLIEAEKVLLAISDNVYTAVASPFTAALGKHMRHITDHYIQLFDGLSDRKIDYDRRERKEIAETERSAMILLLRQINNQLDQLGERTDIDLSVVLSVDETSNTPAVPSTLSRELVFLQSHATHHYAIISAILKMQDINVHEDFGIAPSTLKYEHQRCAH